MHKARKWSCTERTPPAMETSFHTWPIFARTCRRKGSRSSPQFPAKAFPYAFPYISPGNLMYTSNSGSKFSSNNLGDLYSAEEVGSCIFLSVVKQNSDELLGILNFQADWPAFVFAAFIQDAPLFDSWPDRKLWSPASELMPLSPRSIFARLQRRAAGLST